MKTFILKSLYAGIFIGIGSIVYMMNPSIIGAVLFSIGLFGCINNKLNLFTGKVGYETQLSLSSIYQYIIMLLFNVIGISALTGLYYLFANNAMITILNTASIIVNNRLTTNIFGLLVGSICCGMLMSHAVDRPTRSDNDYNNILNYIPMLYCVPVFILSCFPHCVADIGYYTVYILTYGINNHILWIWLICVLGNIIGCQIMGRLARKLY